MYRSKDGKITVAVAQSIGDTILPAADFSIVNIPANGDEAARTWERLYNTPARKHTVLAFTRHTRSSKLHALANLKDSLFTFLDTVHIWYEKPNSSSNIGFLPVAEDGHIFYKTDAPNPKNTAWFSADNPNATNMWGVSPAEHEGRNNTHFRSFAWEIGLLMYTMSQPIEIKRFIYALDDDHPHVLKFCRLYGLSCHIITKSEDEAKKIIARADIT